MFRDHHLRPLTAHDRAIRFTWDPETGAVRGDDAALVRRLADEAAARGETTGDPYPTVYTTKNPLFATGEMAVVLGQYWRLDEELTAAYPSLPSDMPDGAIA